MSKQPARQVCPLCGDDDNVTLMPAGEAGTWSFSCVGGKGHSEPYSWIVTAQDDAMGRDGITEELGVYEDLLLCVRASEPWVEHGIVEHRYKLLRPKIYFGDLLKTYGHVALGPKRYTLSAFLARALGQLRDEGALAWQYAKATGFWYYNGSVSYWAVPPAPPESQRLTWEAYARANQLDAAEWDLTRPDPN